MAFYERQIAFLPLEQPLDERAALLLIEALRPIPPLGFDRLRDARGTRDELRAACALRISAAHQRGENEEQRRAQTEDEEAALAQRSWARAGGGHGALRR